MSFKDMYYESIYYSDTDNFILFCRVYIFFVRVCFADYWCFKFCRCFVDVLYFIVSVGDAYKKSCPIYNETA